MVREEVAGLVEAQQDRPVQPGDQTRDRRDVEAETPRVAVVEVQGPADDRLDRGHVAHHDDDPVARQLHEAFRTRRDPRPEIDEALAAGGGEARIGSPARTNVGGDVAQQPFVPLAVVELDEPLVDPDRGPGRGADPLGGLPGAQQRAREDQARGGIVLEHGRERVGLMTAAFVEGRVGPSEEPAGPVGLGLAVTDEDDHGSPSRSRPACQKSHRGCGR